MARVNLTMNGKNMVTYDDNCFVSRGGKTYLLRDLLDSQQTGFLPPTHCDWNPEEKPEKVYWTCNNEEKCGEQTVDEVCRYCHTWVCGCEYDFLKKGNLCDFCCYWTCSCGVKVGHDSCDDCGKCSPFR
jgi:hypothetical protein